MNAAIYIRVSTDEQAKDGFSLDAQKRKLLLYAQSQDWIVTDIYIDDGFSAKDLNRPEMQRLLKNADNKEFDLVLTYKLDRLTRSVSDCDKLFQLFERLSISYQSATESFETRTATGRMFIRLIANMAQWERENIAERVRFGVEQKTLQGQRIGVFPFGYTNKGELVDEEIPLIKELRELFLSGLGYKKIAMMMNQAGKIRRGKTWSDATVQYTVENPLYYGIVRLGTKNKEGVYVNWRRDERLNCVYGDSIYPSIFTKEEHLETKTEIEKRYKGNGYSRNMSYWFSGVLRCGRCGSAMFGRQVVKKGEVTQYYICSNKHHKKSCNMPTIRQSHIELLLLGFLSDVALDDKKRKDKKQVILNQEEKRFNRSEQLKQLMSSLKNRRSKWQYMFANDLITVDELKARLNEENELLASYEQEISVLSSNTPVTHNVQSAKSLLALWPEMIDSEKKDFISAMFSKITVSTHEVNPRVSKGKYYDAILSEVLFN